MSLATAKLPSQNPDSREDKAFERGFIFGRSAAIRAIREAIDQQYDIRQMLDELDRTDFRA